MIRSASPVRFDRIATSGRTEPLRVAVEFLDRTEADVFLKPSEGCDLKEASLAMEAIGALLAKDLGLPVCEPVLVNLSQEWLNTIADEAVVARLQKSNAVAFATVAAPNGFRIWTAGDNLLADRRDTALAILAFDAFIENVDRRPSNPNCLIRGAEFRIIDHEAAFAPGIPLIGAPPTWSPGGLNWLKQADGHVFVNGLSKSTREYGPIRDSWADLSDARLNEYDQALPASWRSAQPKINAALNRLKGIRDNIDACLTELERVLQ